MEKLYYARDLFKRQKELGLSSGKIWLLRQERKGKLTVRKDPKNWRRFTEKDIESILKAFSPGGKGYWHYAPKESE